MADSKKPFYREKRPWVCKFCGKGFAGAYDLHTHRRKHPEYWDWLIQGTQDVKMQCWLRAEKNFAARFKPLKRK